MHDVLIVSVPLVMILAGILLNRADAKEIRAEMKEHRAEMLRRFDRTDAHLAHADAELRAEMLRRFDQTDAHLARIDADLRQFYHLTGKLEARVDNIEKR